MSDPVSNDIRAVFAFIKDHQGCNANQIALSLEMDLKRVMDALGKLVRARLVSRQFQPLTLDPPRGVYTGSVCYFAKPVDLH